MSKSNEVCDCPKCGGTGYIPAFSGIANGDCFMCSATGKVKAGRVVQSSPLNDLEKRCIAWILNATDDQINRLTWAQISRSRDTVHSGKPEFVEARKVWFERFNDRFNELQDIRWQKVNDRIQAGWARK